MIALRQFIIRDKKGNKDCGDRSYNVSEYGQDGYTIHGSCEVGDNPVTVSLIRDASAHLLDGKALVWNVPEGTISVELISAAEGGVTNDEAGNDLTGAGLERIELVADGNLSADADSVYPAFNGMKKWTLPDTVTGSDLKNLLKGQLVVLAKDAEGIGLQATQVQFPFALDALYYNATNLKNINLGASFEGDRVVVRLWAPTAKRITLQTSDSGMPGAETTDAVMNYDDATGIWSYSTTKDQLDRKFYRYQIEVYRRDTDKVETITVTDPYSLNVSANGAFTQVVNLDDADTRPANWDSVSNAGKRPENIVIYETHIRDISGSDKTAEGVVSANNGKYKAFAEGNRASMTHLKELKDDGLTYLQVLPAFDIATVDEDPEKLADLNDPFSKLCELNESIKTDSDFSGYCGGTETIGSVFDLIKEDDEKPQALNNYLRMYDSFNWGYDPFHYTVPEGTYASDADGVARIKEFREMVVALDQMGLNIAMDVVYNHTNAAGTAPKSVLDKIVPDYYQRLDMTTGAVENSSCCSNTASEQKMMGKLMVDSLKVWTEDYKIDAFRFDLMGLHLKSNMLEIKEELEAINPAMYLYGEGWTMGFGGGAGHPETAATQLNMAGTNIGTFSDRMRDAVRGGGPFDGGNDIRKNQGFGSGAWGVRNELNQMPAKDALLNQMDLIRVGLAGNLADYQFTNYQGDTVKGSAVDYNGVAGGYTMSPIENVSYVSKHDNQTLWDNNQYKLAENLTSRERTRMQILAQALPILGQGVPFIHMGAEVLRSKSMQRDSYDSGDWFNRVNFDLNDIKWDNNWNKGLPSADKDADNWSLIRSITLNDKIAPTREDAQLSVDMMREYLSIRKDSPLFRLQTASDVQKAVKFHNTGTDQVGGVIVMELRGDALTPTVSENLVVMVNATAEEKSHTLDNYAIGYSIHDLHKNFTNGPLGTAVADGKTLTIPPRTVVVFTEIKSS